MEDYDFEKDKLETFFISKKFKKIKKQVTSDFELMPKKQKFKCRKSNKYSNIKIDIPSEVLRNNEFMYNKFILDIYNAYYKNDKTIFNISWKSFSYSILLAGTTKIIIDIIGKLMEKYILPYL